MLRIKDLKLSYSDELIFGHLNLDVRKGEIAVVTGLSGCGKSSLLKVINGIIPEVTEARAEGEVRYSDHDLLKEDIACRSRYMSTVFQNPKTQFYCINSTDELAFGLENRAVEREEILKTIDDCTRLLNTRDLLDRDIFSLSGGEKQLLAISAVTCLDNDIYLFDEPSASLDRRAIGRFQNVLKILKEAGKIVIIAEHRLYYLKELMDHVLVIDDKQAFHYTGGEFVNNFGSLSGRYHLRDINELTKDDLNDIKRIQLVGNPDVQNESNVEKSLNCCNFKVKYDQPVLDLSIDFAPGVYFIIGENGVGKSTFVRTLCNLNRSKGKRYYDHKSMKKTYDYISMVMQDVNYQIFTESCYDELAVISQDEELILKSLKEVNLLDKKDIHPQILSGGEKQRLLLAKAKVSTKPVIILDEPTSGLDKLQMERMILFLDEMKNEGKIVLVITHDYELIKEYDGKILEFIRSGIQWEN